MKKDLIIPILAMTIAFSGCTKFLDMVPEKDIETIESIFEVKYSALNFYNTCNTAAHMEMKLGDFSYDPGIICGGEFAIGNYSRRSSTGTGMKDVLSIADGYQNTNSPYVNLWTMDIKDNRSTGSVYTCIRYCNIFIDNVDKVNDMPIWEKKAWKAEIKCLKAFYYFELMKRYGPIVLMPKNIESNVDIREMQIPRSHVDTCFNEIVRLFDEAIPDLRTRKNIPKEFKSAFNLEGAYAYKARVLLYAASPLFNGNYVYADFKNRNGEPLFNPKYNSEKWKRAADAVDEAIKIAEEGNIRLFQGTQSELTTKLNQIRDIQYSILYLNWDVSGEWLHMKMPIGMNSANVLPKFKTNHALSSANAYGVIAPNITTVEMYYTDNGLPITKDRTWPYNNRYKMGKEVSTEYTDVVDLKGEVLNLHLRREPRFYANIAAAGTYSVYNNKNYLVEPIKGESMGTELPRFNDGSSPQNLTGYWMKKTIPINTSPGQISGGYPVVMMRLADLYLMQAEAWNEYAGPSKKVYDAIDKVRIRAGILPLCQAWEQYSTSPDDIKTKEGLREIIHQERMIEFAFEGHHYWDLKRWKKAENVLNKPHTGWNVMGDSKKAFYNNFEQPIVVCNKPKFIAPRDYFWPIKSEEIMISDIVQNPGW